MAACTGLPSVNYYTAADVYHYTTDNAVIASLAARDDALCGMLNASFSDSYKDVPSNHQTISYTLQYTDRGFSVDTTAGVTVPPSSSMSTQFPVGAVVSVTNLSSSPITITAGSGVTLNLAGTGSPGNRTLAGYGVMTMRQPVLDTWYCIGAGLT